MQKIVLIEDEDLLRRSLAHFLKTKGYEIEAFDNGLDAIGYLQGNTADVAMVVTDLNLPFAGGKQVIHACNQLAQNHIRIIVLTASGVENTELEVFELGADDFIAKPFSPAVLLKRIEKLWPGK